MVIAGVNSRRFIHAAVISTLALGAATSSSVARADDLAVVCGVRHYPNLSPRAELAGIENDVRLMERVLRGAGFRVVTLFDAQATKSNISAALVRAKSEVHAGDRFVYYQSSHGASDHRLLTFDTTSSGENTITTGELQTWLGRVPTARKSLILDACFSGGFKTRGGTELVKFFALNGVKERLDRVVRGQDRPAEGVTNPPGSAHPYAVFASSQANEPSLLLTRDDTGERQSVFTWSLAEHITAGSPRTWTTVVQPTVEAVQIRSQYRQTPVFSSEYLAAGLFTTEATTPPPSPSPESAPPTRQTFATIFNFANVGEELSLRALAEQPLNANRQARPGTRIRLMLKVNRPGYLFVFNRDDTDMVQIVGWRATELDFRNAESMVEGSTVSPGAEFELGQGNVSVTTQARDGEERWKAFLFPDRSGALEFANAWLRLTGKGGEPAKRVEFTKVGVKARDLTQRPRQALFTSEVHYLVTRRAE